MTQQTRTQEFLTPIELQWLNVFRTAQESSPSGRLTFESVEVADGRVWAKRIIETIHCQVPSGVAVRR